MLEYTQMSERRACRLVGLSRDAWRHPPQPDAHTVRLGERIHAVAMERRRFGYRRVHDMLRTEFPGTNHKKVSWFNQNRHLDQVISDPQGKIESMNDKKPRRHFDPAVKLQMIEMVRNQGLSVAQVCSEMKLSRSVLSRWLNQFDQEQAGRPGKGIPLTAEQRRICELEMQVRQLQSDNALLKKASAFFARELQ